MADDRTPTAPTDTREQRSVLVATGVSAFLGPFMGSALNLAMPLIGTELGAPAVTLSWVVTAYLIASAAFLLPFGRIGDLWGRKRVFVAGAVIHALFSLACGLAPAVGQLIAFRVAQGVGASMGFATGIAILVSASPPRHRGRVLGLVTAAVYCGLSVGPVVGGVLTQHLGWRSIFMLNTILGLGVAVTAWVGIRSEWRSAAGQRFDHAGAWLYGVSLAALIGGISNLETSPSARWAAAAGALGLLSFVAVELKASQPLLDLRLFRSTVFAFSNLAALIHYSATFAVTFLLSLYLQTAAGLDPQRAGLVLLSQPVLMALLSPVAGRLSDRVEPRLVASAGMLVSLLGLLPLVFLARTPSVPVVVASLVVLGTGFGLFSSPNTNAVMGAVPRQHYGIGSATLSTMRVVGQALSMALVAVILGHHMGQRPLGPETVPELVASTRTAFSLFSALCVVGLFASLARGRVQRLGGGGQP